MAARQASDGLLASMLEASDSCLEHRQDGHWGAARGPRGGQEAVHEQLLIRFDYAGSIRVREQICELVDDG